MMKIITDCRTSTTFRRLQYLKQNGKRLCKGADLNYMERTSKFGKIRKDMGSPKMRTKVIWEARTKERPSKEKTSHQGLMMRCALEHQIAALTNTLRLDFKVLESRETGRGS